MSGKEKITKPEPDPKYRDSIETEPAFVDGVKKLREANRDTSGAEKGGRRCREMGPEIDAIDKKQKALQKELAEAIRERDTKDGEAAPLRRVPFAPDSAAAAERAEKERELSVLDRKVVRLSSEFDAGGDQLRAKNQEREEERRRGRRALCTALAGLARQSGLEARTVVLEDGLAIELALAGRDRLLSGAPQVCEELQKRRREVDRLAEIADRLVTQGGQEIVAGFLDGLDEGTVVLDTIESVSTPFASARASA